jgi:hypothetical protein
MWAGDGTGSKCPGEGPPENPVLQNLKFTQKPPSPVRSAYLRRGATIQLDKPILGEMRLRSRFMEKFSDRVLI